MHSHVVLCMAQILPVLSASNVDISWPFYDDSLSPDPEFLLDQIDQISSPVNQISSLFDTSQLPDESIYENQEYDFNLASNKDDGWAETSSWNDIPLEDSFDPPECSSSQILPAIGRSRVKRLDEPGTCKDRPVASFPSSGNLGGVSSTSPDLSGLNELLPQTPGDVGGFQEAMGDEDQNTFCVLYTNFVLPVGVCSAGEIMVDGVLTIPSGGVFYHYTLKRFTIGMFWIESQPTT